MNIPSASGLPRAFRCRASLALPQIHRGGSAFAHKGSAVHKFLEDAPRIGREKALEAIEDESARLLCEALDLSALPLGDGVSWAAEVAFSLDPVMGTAREVGRGIGRAYPEDGGLHGTADLVALSPDGQTVHILDAKTGHGWMPSAADSEQLKALALMAVRAYEASDAMVGHLHLRDDGSVWTQWASLSALDLAAFEAELWQVLDVKPGAAPVEGGWCRWCPSFGACPAKTALATSMAVDADGVVPMTLTAENAALVWQRLKAAREVLARVEEAVEQFALDNPVSLADGTVLGPVETKRDELDGEGAFKALAKAYGDDVARQACELAATKKSVDRAMRALREKEKPGATLKALNAEALELIRKAGALKTTTKVSVREHRLPEA